ncbi:MAG TPA: low molecular weight protein-tyrosine-phosphatase [Rhizomicrobium sp.]|nr:low molecular weight protein-tyrosine-phosphatase [Rhizomicrobium sp.]
MSRKSAVLFVCLGNICRSPLAEAAFRAEAARLNLDVEVDSAGIGDWHEGEAPDPRAQAVARRHGVDISGQRARQVRRDDFRRFTHIVALDRENLAALKRLGAADAPVELSLLLDCVEGRKGQPVADPWYGTAADFERTWADVTAGARGLAQKIAERG